MNRKQIGQYIAKKRKELKMTQKELADSLFVSFQAVSKWERGASLPDITMLEKVANTLHISMYELMYRASSKYSIDELVESLNQHGITKDNYNDLGLLVQSGILYSEFITHLEKEEVVRTLYEVLDNIEEYKDMKLIKCSHSIVGVYVKYLEFSFKTDINNINDIQYTTIIDDINYDNVVLNKVIKDYVKEANSVVLVLNTHDKHHHIYVACSDDLVEKGYSAYFISNLISRAITIPSEYGTGGGGIHNRAGFTLRKNHLIEDYISETNRLVKEYTKNYQNYRISITSHTN